MAKKDFMSWLRKAVDALFKATDNWIRLRPVRRWFAGRDFVRRLEGELTEEFLELLLRLMGLWFHTDAAFRKNIEGFEGSYVFQDKAKDFLVSVDFRGGRMTVAEKDLSNARVRIVFKDEAALFRLLLAEKPDAISAVLSQDVRLTGNLNYFYKFAYMITHLKLNLTKTLPILPST
jgi:hypothetical protein